MNSEYKDFYRTYIGKDSMLVNPLTNGCHLKREHIYCSSGVVSVVAFV